MSQRILYHQALCANSRAIRLLLAEKGLDFELQEVKPWLRDIEFLTLNPAGNLPVLREETGMVVCGLLNIALYLDEQYPENPICGHNLTSRVEIRRLFDWFNEKFQTEVTNYLVGEKITKRITKQGYPDAKLVRAGASNINYHLEYIKYLTERRRWLAGEMFSLADLVAAAHLSCVDYIGNVPWDRHSDAKDWYARIKSRPSFRALLLDRITGMPPVKSYADLDF